MGRVSKGSVAVLAANHTPIKPGVLVNSMELADPAGSHFFAVSFDPEVGWRWVHRCMIFGHAPAPQYSPYRISATHSKQIYRISAHTTMDVPRHVECGVACTLMILSCYEYSLYAAFSLCDRLAVSTRVGVDTCVSS